MERTPRNRGKHPWDGSIPSPQREQVSAEPGTLPVLADGFSRPFPGLFLPVPLCRLPPGSHRPRGAAFCFLY